MQLRSWMIPAEACLGTFVALKGACGKTTTTQPDDNIKSKYSLSPIDKTLNVRNL